MSNEIASRIDRDIKTYNKSDLLNMTSLDEGEGLGNMTGGGSYAFPTTDMSHEEPTQPFLLDDDVYSVTLNSYVMPLVISVTVVTNVMVCAVLLRRHMRTATNTVLVAMAISDLLTGVWPMPTYVYFYILVQYTDWVPYRWCFLYHALNEFLPTISHTVSIWLTVYLAAQRYLLVCHSLDARKWCSISNTVKTIAFIYILAIVSQVCRFFEYGYIPVLFPSRLDKTRDVLGCQVVLTSFIKVHEDIYYSVYYIFRIVFIHLVPCLTLVVLNGMLIQTMRRARVRRQQLHKMNRKSECRRLAETTGTTLMLVLVVGVFLLVEFPLALHFIVYIWESMAGVILLDPSTARIASQFVNFFILLSYPLNFVIYCAMSQQFRQTFIGLFRFGGSQEASREGGSGSGGGVGGGDGGSVGRGEEVGESVVVMKGVCRGEEGGKYSSLTVFYNVVNVRTEEINLSLTSRTSIGSAQ